MKLLYGCIKKKFGDNNITKTAFVYNTYIISTYHKEPNENSVHRNKIFTG